MNPEQNVFGYFIISNTYFAEIVDTSILLYIKANSA